MSGSCGAPLTRPLQSSRLGYARSVALPSPRRLTTPPSVNAAIKEIAAVMRRANYAGDVQHFPELSWMLFLRILGLTILNMRYFRSSEDLVAEAA